jgi:hypothetical protein
MSRESIYWFIVFLTFVYVILKFNSNLVKILIIICFYAGLASFLGKSVENPYKIILVLLSLYLIQKNNCLAGLSKGENFLLIIFALFSVSFLYSALINEDYFTLVFSQYGKYVTPVCLFFVFNRIYRKNPAKFIRLNDLFISLLTIQIILSVIKIFTIGLQETTVGSTAYVGGGLAAELPVFGFILVWLNKNGDIRKKGWIYIFLLMFIAFASLKRAVWFIMPAVILLFTYYIPRKVTGRKWLFVLPLIPLIFYLGIRLSPTLNKESKIWGSFDLQYVMDYSQNYNFGKTQQTQDVQLGQGRGGATFLLWDKLFRKKALSSSDYWGVGLKEVYTTDYEQFEDVGHGLNSKGSVTGIFQSYLTAGYVGILVTILFIISILGLIKESRIRVTFALLMFWDYFFYSGLILRSQVLFILLFYIIIYSNLQFDQNLYSKYLNRKLYAKNRNLLSRPA